VFREVIGKHRQGGTGVAGDGVLASWRGGPARTAILDFVARVTEEGGPDEVAPDMKDDRAEVFAEVR
jgi:hypothetical protein